MALTTAVVAIASLGAISEFARDLTARTGLAASFFVSNVYLYRSPTGYFDVAPTANPLLHMWSLSVEEQFYLVFPAVLVLSALLARRSSRPARPIITTVLLVLAAASLLLCVVATRGGAGTGVLSSRFAFYMAPARAWEFAVGALLQLGAHRAARIPRAPAIVIGLAGAVLIALGATVITATTPFPGTAALLPVLGTGLLLVAGTATTGGISSLLGLRPVTVIGDLSYSWYLWHWPVIVFTAALWPGADRLKIVAAAASIVPAAVSYRWLERPIHLNPGWKGVRAVGLASVCIAVPVVACLVLVRAPLPTPSASTHALLQATRQNHADRTRGCNKGLPVARQPSRCTWSVADPSGRIVLLGDSNAGHMTEPLAAAANRLGYDFTVTTLPDCPFIDARIAGGQADSGTCRRYVQTTTRGLLADPPALVVLGASTSIYLRPGSAVTLTDPATGTVAGGEQDKVAAWSAALHRTLTTFERAGIRTLVVHAVPQWLTWDARNCAAIRVYFAPRSCGAQQSRAEDAHFRANAVTAETAAVRTVPTARAVDVTDEICDRRACATNRGDFWVYRDGRHLSVRGSLLLTDTFAAALRTSLAG